MSNEPHFALQDSELKYFEMSAHSSYHFLRCHPSSMLLCRNTQMQSSRSEFWCALMTFTICAQQPAEIRQIPVATWTTGDVCISNWDVQVWFSGMQRVLHTCAQVTCQADRFRWQLHMCTLTYSVRTPVKLLWRWKPLKCADARRLRAAFFPVFSLDKDRQRGFLQQLWLYDRW